MADGMDGQLGRVRSKSQRGQEAENASEHRIFGQRGRFVVGKLADGL